MSVANFENRFPGAIDRRGSTSPLISVITPCLNAEKFVEEYMRALSQWKRECVEVIVIDGGSTDRTIDLLKSNAFIDLIVSGTDKGIFDAMNIGISMARGKYIGILNIDDSYSVDTIDLVSKWISNDHTCVYHGAMEVLGKSNRIVNISHTEIERRMINHPTMFVPSSLYQQFGGFDLRFKVAADYDFTYKLITNNIQFIESEKVLAQFREGGFSSRHEFRSLIESTQIQRKFQKNSKIWLLSRIILRVTKHIWRRIQAKTLTERIPFFMKS